MTEPESPRARGGIVEMEVPMQLRDPITEPSAVARDAGGIEYYPRLD